MKHFIPKSYIITLLFYICGCTPLLSYFGKGFYLETDSIYGREICLSHTDTVWVHYIFSQGKIDSILCKPGGIVLRGYISNHLYIDDWLFVKQKNIPPRLDKKFIRADALQHRQISHIPDSAPYYFNNYTEAGQKLIKESPQSYYWALNNETLTIYGPYLTQESLENFMKTLNFHQRITLDES